MKALVVWFNPNKKKYYYKVVKNLFDKYYVGFKNQYGHVVILVVDIYKELIYREPLRNKVISRLIYFLHKLKR